MQTAQKNFHKKLLGRAGENLAAKELKRAGYVILERNFTTHVGEIDIIAKDGDVIVFVEVKTRTSDDFGAPSEAVGREKRRKYGLVAQEYLLRKKCADVPCRFDVIEIENDRINHIEDAFSI